MKHKKKLDKGRKEHQSSQPGNSHGQSGINDRTSEATGLVYRRFGLTSLLVLLVALGISLAINAGYDARWASQWIFSKFKEPIVTLGGVDVHGYFPKGCIWRPVRSSSSNKEDIEEEDKGLHKKKNKRADIWRVRQYEYWSSSTQAWSSKRPLECELESEEVAKFQGKRIPSSWETKIETDRNYTVLRNLWYNNGLYYSLQKQNGEKVRVLDDNEHGLDRDWFPCLDMSSHMLSLLMMQSSFQMTSNIDCNRLVVKDHESFVSNIDAHYVTGESLLIDFVYFIHPVCDQQTYEYNSDWDSNFVSLCAADRHRPLAGTYNASNRRSKT